LAGNNGEALKVLDKFGTAVEQRYVSPAVIAFVYESLGDTWLAYLRVDPRWDKLRDTPRFQDLLHRMNFPD
jgi:hypothetical protein